MPAFAFLWTVVLMGIVFEPAMFGRWLRAVHNGFQQGTKRQYEARKTLVRALFAAARNRPKDPAP